MYGIPKDGVLGWMSWGVGAAVSSWGMLGYVMLYIGG